MVEDAFEEGVQGDTSGCFGKKGGVLRTCSPGRLNVCELFNAGACPVTNRDRMNRQQPPLMMVFPVSKEFPR
jgi:hypothetical protein